MSRKGQLVVSHALALGLTIILVLGLVLVFNNFRTEQSGPLAEAQLQSICFRIKSTAEAIWSPTSIETNATMGRFLMNLPFRTGGASYTVEMSGSEISLVAPDIPASVSCYTSVAELSGSSGGGLTELTWIREGQTDRIVMN